VRKIRPYDFSNINDIYDECKLEEIPPKGNRKTTKEYCHMHLEDETNTNRGPQTRFWCGNCKVPVCILKCYDKHREVSKLKKFRLNDE